MTDPPKARATVGPDLLSAVGRHFVLFLAPILVLAGLGAGYGLIRKPQYTAETRISIGQLSVTTQGLPGFLTAAANLAAAYSRTVEAPQVIAAAARAAGVSNATARDALSSSSIPNTPLFRIEAVSTDSHKAVTLANAATNALVLHVLDLNKRANLRDRILTSYKSAAAKVASLQRQSRLAGNKPSSVSINARLQIAQLREFALGRLYDVSAAGDVEANLLQPVVTADHATSDRKTTIERWALIGALVGLIAGLALAAGRASALERRSAEG